MKSFCLALAAVAAALVTPATVLAQGPPQMPSAGVRAASVEPDAVAAFHETDGVARDFASTFATAVGRNAFAGAQIATGSGGASDRHHTFGVGGRAGGFTFGVGASARYWGSEKLGLQADVSHYGISTIGITQIAPSVLFVLGNPDLSKSTQIRPYAGGGINIMRIAEDYSDFGFSELNGSETSLGGQGMVGAEMIFGGAPNFALSGDLGYYSTGKFFGVSIGGFALSISGHYYFK